MTFGAFPEVCNTSILVGFRPSPEPGRSGTYSPPFAPISSLRPLRKGLPMGKIFELPGAEHAYGSTMNLVERYYAFGFRRAKRAEGGFQPIKALLGCPEYGEEAWCKISARSV